MYGNPAFECAGATLHAVCRQLATVVTVDGVIDEINLDRLTALALRFVIPEKPYILDLGHVESFATHAVSLLSAIDERCYHRDVEWALIAGEPVRRALQNCTMTFPLADSVPDAMHEFAERLEERRRLLPLLTKKTA